MIHDKRAFLKILKEIKKNNITIFQPSIKPGIGFQYKELEFGFHNFDKQMNFLKELEKMDIVESKEGISIILCNSCSRFNFSLRSICGYCKSFNIKKGLAIEHDICHNIDFEDKYLQSDGSLKCDKCNKILKAIGVDYSKINIFKCIMCNGISSDVEQQYTCLSCGKTNFKTELLISNLFDYIICQSKLISLINDLEYILPIVEELDRLGIKSCCPATATGISETTHIFDLIAYDSYNKPTLILETLELSNDYIYGNQESIVLSFIGKYSDFNVSNKILVTFAEIPQNLMNLLKMNKITVLKMHNREESLIEIVQLITEFFNNTIEPETMIHSG